MLCYAFSLTRAICVITVGTVSWGLVGSKVGAELKTMSFSLPDHISNK